jgi:hypothetical protein
MKKIICAIFLIAMLSLILTTTGCSDKTATAAIASNSSSSSIAVATNTSTKTPSEKTTVLSVEEVIEGVKNGTYQRGDYLTVEGWVSTVWLEGEGGASLKGMAAYIDVAGSKTFDTEAPYLRVILPSLTKFQAEQKVKLEVRYWATRSEQSIEVEATKILQK